MKQHSITQLLLCSALVVLLLLPYIYTTFVAIELVHLPLKQIAYLGVSLFLLFLPACFLKARTYFIIEGIGNFLLFPIEISSLYLNHQPTSATFLFNIFHTNFEEAKELVLALYPFGIAIVLLYVLFFFLTAKVKNIYLFPSIHKTYWALTILGLWVIGLTAMWKFANPNREEMSFKENLRFANDHLIMKVYKIFPYNIYVHSYKLLQQQREINKLQQQVASFQFDIPHKATDSAELYILIIGEAARYDHQGFNGYERNTTPYLSALPNFISFDSIYSEANLTGNSLPLLLTRATAHDRELAYKEKTLPEAFAQSGFDTYWLLKQVPYSFVKRALPNATYYYSEASSTDTEDNYDGNLIPILQSLGTIQRPSMMVVHLLGSHFRYDQRYPQEYKVFQPTWDKEHFSYMLINPNNKDWFINAYDNTILYTDYVVSQIIAWADSCNQPAVVMYLSDHGESLWDDDNIEVLHGSYNALPKEYHIPFCVWYSNEYKQKYPDRVAAMFANKEIKQNTEIAFYSMLDLADIPIPNTQHKSVCGSLQGKDTLYVITGKGDVDILHP